MSDEISGPHPIKFGRANTMSLTESGWVISIKNADGKELFYFEIPFEKYLKSKSSQMN